MNRAKLAVQIAVVAVIALQGAGVLAEMAPKSPAYMPQTVRHTAASVFNYSDRDAIRECASMLVPAPMLSTPSKYQSSDISKAQIDAAARLTRDSVLKPVQLAVRQLGEMVYTQNPDAAGAELELECGVSTLMRWAAAGSLSGSGTKDFSLTRGRLLAEISLSVLELDRRGTIGRAERQVIGPWLEDLAGSTISFFAVGAGPQSSINNHRYWAGLALTAIGIFLERDDYIQWGQTSLQTGACQVAADGTLPLELARSTQARNYHLYALRPLVATAWLLQVTGKVVTSNCRDGLERLAETALLGIRDEALFFTLTGAPQAPMPSEASYIPPLRLGSELFGTLQAGMKLASVNP